MIEITPEQEKQIKRINQRLAKMEKTGYKGTGIYNKLVTAILTSGLQTSKSRGGDVRLSRAKKQKAGNGLFTFQQNLNYIENQPKLATELHKAKKEDYFKGDTPKERVISKFNFRERLDDFLQQMYDDMNRGNMYAFELANQSRKGLRNETYDYLESLMNNIEETRNKLIEENVNYQNSIFEDYNDF